MAQGWGGSLKDFGLLVGNILYFVNGSLLLGNHRYLALPLTKVEVAGGPKLAIE
jgi:hypothetical protein